MNEIVDLNPIVRGVAEAAARRERYSETYREGFQQKMNHLHNDAEGAIDYAKDLLAKANADIGKELAQLDQFINDITLAVGIVKHTAMRMAETPTQFWTE
jgi:hypothetical protein